MVDSLTLLTPQRWPLVTFLNSFVWRCCNKLWWCRSRHFSFATFAPTDYYSAVACELWPRRTRWKFSVFRPCCPVSCSKGLFMWTMWKCVTVLCADLKQRKRVKLAQTHSRNIYCTSHSLRLTKIFFSRTRSDSLLGLSELSHEWVRSPMVLTWLKIAHARLW